MSLFRPAHSRTAYFTVQAKHPVWKLLQRRLRELGYNLRRSPLKRIPNDAGVVLLNDEDPTCFPRTVSCGDHFRQYFQSQTPPPPFASRPLLGATPDHRFTLVTDCHQLPDCLAAGSVPIFCGTCAIPPTCYIDSAPFATQAELEKHLTTIPADQHAEMVSAGRAFLRARFVDCTMAQIVRKLELCEREHRAPH